MVYGCSLFIEEKYENNCDQSLVLGVSTIL